MTPANNACKPSVSHSNSVGAPRSGLRDLNYTTVAVYTDMHRSDVPVSAVSGCIRIATTTDTSTPAVNIITFAWSDSIIIKTVCGSTQVVMMKPVTWDSSGLLLVVHLFVIKLHFLTLTACDCQFRHDFIIRINE